MLIEIQSKLGVTRQSVSVYRDLGRKEACYRVAISRSQDMNQKVRGIKISGKQGNVPVAEFCEEKQSNPDQSMKMQVLSDLPLGSRSIFYVGIGVC